MTRTITAACFVLVVAAAPVVSRAALVAETNFTSVNTTPDPDQTPITERIFPSSGTAVVVPGGNTPNINTGPTGLSGNFRDNLLSGMLEITGSNGGGVRSLDTGGTNNQVLDYLGVGSSGLNQGALFTVFRPNFDGIQTGRRTLVGHQIQSSSQIWLFNNDNVDGPTLRLGANGEQGANLPNFTWDSNSWYFVGGAWRTTPNGSNVDIEVNLYVRSLSDLSAPVFTDTRNFLNQSNGSFTDPLYLGVRDSGTESADGDIALFRLYNNFFSTSDFDGVVNSLLVPEPTSGHLLLGGALLLLRRRRRR